jgi:predicted ATP-grasp superfamily ATP-dependent carboligase
MQSISANNEILVIGGNHQNTLGIIEALGNRGLYPYVIINDSRKSSYVLKSKYVKRGWIFQKNIDIIDCLIRNFSCLPQKTVVIACSDNMASLLSDNYYKLCDFLYLPTIKGDGELTKWTNKDYMTNVAKSLGLNVPKSWLVSANNIPDDVIYPCVTKSLSSVNNGKTEFTICRNKEELKAFLRSCVHSSCIQIQQYIDKDFEFQFLGCSLNCGNEIIIPGRTHIDETYHFNNITFLKYKECKVIEDSTTLLKSKEFIRETGYSGLFSVEFMHGKDGKDYFLEMNFRNDGNSIIVFAAGTNLPYIWYLYCIGGDYNAEIQRSKVAESYLMPEDSYFMLMLDGEISFSKWMSNLRKTTCFLTYFKGDTSPFWSLMWMQKKPIFASLVTFILRSLRILKQQ